MRELIDKYIDGRTTGDEERLLREHFASPATIVGDDMRWMRALSQFTEAERLPAVKSRREYYAVAKIAASVAIVLSAWLLYPGNKVSESFAVVDGKRVTDRTVVEAEALDALNFVSTDNEEMYGALGI
ncbi:MAG: hypothetical protein SOZ80_01570 [Prevotella sp.]|uniref:hypothetical protein n=1 Tax=Prevotella sp. TaxID=59823 RepID=UPI002A254007|nr:hypothetical protein [Prevotella sp.]MDD7317358.1 hypothetical protein [Prevotellaceae bacterium]MDY4019456.1 hypothetical protein [Prevotella sp.]